MGISIIGTGMYVPENVVTNEDMSKIVDTNDEWITSRTGIKTRHFADNITTYKMGANAAVEAIKNANLSVEDIDMIILSTATPDYVTPSTACFVANEIGAFNAVCFDISCACSGFVYALDMANRYLLDEEYNNILIVSSEMLSKITDFTDRSTCVLFGDGAAACVVQKGDKQFACKLGADVSGVSKLFGRGIPPSNPFMETPFDPLSDGFAETSGHNLYMDGREVYKFATRIMPKAVELACEKAGITPSDLALIVPHQANIRIVETAAKNLKLPIDKFYVNVHQYGNTSSASIPICLNEASKNGRIKPGDKICVVGFGAGLTYAAAVLEW